MKTIKDIRSKLSISQTKLAKILNVSAQAIWYWENERRKPTPLHLSIVEAMHQLHDQGRLTHEDIEEALTTIPENGHAQALLIIFGK